jgi:peptidoglycan/LPS O-acetylase OafA/YrhL
LHAGKALSTTALIHHIPSLDGIRALCVAMVLGGHVVLHARTEGEVSAGDYFFNGNLGVRIFFVLSGFLITYLMVREEQSAGRIDLKRFYARRALRIVRSAMRSSPCSPCSTCSPRWTEPPAATSPRSRTPRIRLLAVGRRAPVVAGGGGAVLPALAVPDGLPSERWRFGVMMGAVLAAPLFRVAFKLAELPWYSQQWFAPTMDSLMIGACAGVLLAESPERVARLVRMRPTLGRALALFALYLPWLLKLQREAGWFTVPFGPTLQALAGTYLILSYALVKEGVGYRLLNTRLLREVGVLSYSLYIWQQLFIAPSGTYGAADPILTLSPTPRGHLPRRVAILPLL